MDKEIDVKHLEEKIHTLAEAMQDSESKAEHMKGQLRVAREQLSKLNRLERLAGDITDVFGDLPIQNGLFTFSLEGEGTEQHFVIDNDAYVYTNASTQEYVFKKETRLGTALMGHTPNRRLMAKMLTRYISEKILDQQRHLENEFISMRLSNQDDHDEDAFDSGDHALVNEFEGEEEPKPAVEIVEKLVTKNRTSLFAMITWFILGVLATILSVVVAALNGKYEVILDWMQRLIDMVSKSL